LKKKRRADAAPAGKSNWKSNQAKARDLYFEAMEADSANALPIADWDAL